MGEHSSSAQRAGLGFAGRALRPRLYGLVIAGAFAALASSASATVVVGGSVAGDTIFAQWVGPVYEGTLLDAVTGLPYGGGSVNTSSTAVVDLGSSVPSSSATLTWGDNPGVTPPPPVSSSLTFDGGVIPDNGTKGTTPFVLGTIAYTNGTSVNGSEIFGATLLFYAYNGVSDIPIGSDFVALTATVNDGTAAQNADYANFAGTGQSFNTYEGATALGELHGVIVGDPMTNVLFVTLDPDQTDNGFIGSSLPAPVPEPATWAMMLIGIGGLGAVARNRRRRQAEGAVAA